MLTRRTALRGLATTAAFTGFARSATAETYANEVPGYGPLLPDPKGILDLPKGFRYQIISRAGEMMNDGFLTPGSPDGMGCFADGPGRVILVRNHELGLDARGLGAAGANALHSDRVYDRFMDDTPLPGGTTTLVYDLAARRLVSQHLSLAGTAVNCAGGVTPWSTWISCEETTVTTTSGIGKDHGYAFEVPAFGRGLAEPVPLRAMGRFKHEAACVDPRTGVIYMTEDVADGLFYRFLPDARSQPKSGGRLQALALKDAPQGGDTRNWKASQPWARGAWRDARWIDLDGVDNPHDDLRLRGHAKGAALFARGEGVFFGAGELYFACTSGGAADCGQIMRYVPSPKEGQSGEADNPGRLQLFVEPSDANVMNYADNIAVSPWGHVIACEDKYTPVRVNHMKGITPEGLVYTLARNAMADQGEFAGVCFSPDGTTMFVNIQRPGITFAVQGPWRRLLGKGV